MAPKPSKPVCKFHPRCNRESCTFAHPQPNRRKPSQPSSPSGSCTNSNHTSANGTDSTILQSNKLKDEQHSNLTSPMIAAGEGNTAVEHKAPCSFYLMGQCGNAEGCDFAHVKLGESATKQASIRPLSSSKPEIPLTSPTCPGSSSIDVSDTFNCADEEKEGGSEVPQPFQNDGTQSFAKSALADEPALSSSPTVLQAPLTTRAPVIRVSQPIQQVTPEYPHISQVMLHWSQFADPLANPDWPFCKLHAQGKCTKVESCTFRHSLTVEEYFSLFRDPQPTLATVRNEGDPIRTEGSMMTIQPVIPPTALQPTVVSSQTYPTPSLSPIVSNVASQQKKECLYFPSGKCKNGDRCPFAHIEAPAPPNPPESNEDDNWTGVTTQKAKINKPCKFFTGTYGYCRLNSDCHYLHGQDASSGASGPQSTLEADEVDWTSSNDIKGHDSRMGHVQDWGKNDQTDSIAGAAHDGEGREDDQTIDEWNKPQDSSSWETNTGEETKSNWENRDNQTRRPPNKCFRFEAGTCRYGMSCKYSHDLESGDGLGYSSATQATEIDDSWSSTRQNGKSDLWRTPDFAETQEPEPWEKTNVEENSRQPGDDDGDDDDWTAKWKSSQEPIDLPPVKRRECCLAYGQGYCGKGGQCQFRHSDPSPTTASLSLEEDASLSSLPTAALENERFVDISASTDSPNEPEETSLASNVPGHPKLEIFIMNTTVSFGPTLAPVSIETLADCRKLRLSNIPIDMPLEDVQTLVQPYAGAVLENTLRNFQSATSVEVDFADVEQARSAFEYLHLQKYSTGGRKSIASFATAVTPSKLRLPAERYTLKVSWPKPTLPGWSHYPTIKKAKEEVTRLNGVIFKGRKIQVEFCSPDKWQKDNFAIKFSNMSLETTKVDIRQLCDGHTLVTGFDTPTYRDASLDAIKEQFQSFGDPDFEKMHPENDEGPNSFAFVTFPCEAIAHEVIQELGSRKLNCIGEQSLDIKSVYFARYRVTRRIVDVVQQEIERMKEGGIAKYTIQYDENFGHYIIRLFASPKQYSGFIKANAELCALLQGTTARFDDGSIIWDDYFEMPTSAKAVAHFLKSQAKSIIPDERTRRIRIFGSKDEQKRAMEPLLKLLSKVLDQRHEVMVPRGSMRSLIQQFEGIQTKVGVNKITFDVLNSKIIVRGSDEERSEVQTLVDSSNTPTVYKQGCCEVCHHEPDEPKILACLHVYCTPCLRMAMRSTSHAPVQCIGLSSPTSDDDTSPCSAYIPYIDGILPPTERDRLLLSSFLSHVRESQELFVCPSVDCKAVYRTGGQGLNLLCSRCRTEICSFCQTLTHVGLSCSDMKNHISL